MVLRQLYCLRSAFKVWLQKSRNVSNILTNNYEGNHGADTIWERGQGNP